MVSVSSDKTLVCRQPDGRGLTVGTIPHPVIGLIGDPVMADSFPMAGKYFMHWLKVCFTQKMLVKWSKCHSSEPFFALEEGGKFKLMNGTDKMLIFSFFCISKINL